MDLVILFWTFLRERIEKDFPNPNQYELNHFLLKWSDPAIQVFVQTELREPEPEQHDAFSTTDRCPGSAGARADASNGSSQIREPGEAMCRGGSGAQVEERDKFELVRGLKQCDSSAGRGGDRSGPPRARVLKEISQWQHRTDQLNGVRYARVRSATS